MLSVIKFTPKAAKCLATSMRRATREWGDCGFRRNAGESVRSEYPRTLLQPDRTTENSPWREPWEKGARGKPRMGRKTTAPRSFAPCRGLREPGDLPMAHAMGYSLSLLRASIRSIYGIPVLLSRTRINERSCPLPPRRAERCRSYELRFAAFTESQFSCRAPASMREAAPYLPDEPNPPAPRWDSARSPSTHSTRSEEHT